MLGYVRHKGIGGSGKSDYGPKILGAGPETALLPTSEAAWANRGSALEIQGADADRPADLMPGDGEGIDSEICNIKGHMQPTLDGVGVIDGPVGMSYIGKCSDGLDDAGLVVGEHDRHKRDIGSHERFELGRFDISSTVPH